MATIETSVEKSRWGALYSLLNKRVAAYRKHLLINFGLFICSEMKGQFDITFPALQCSIISVDAMDISGLAQFLPCPLNIISLVKLGLG